MPQHLPQHHLHAAGAAQAHHQQSAMEYMMATRGAWPPSQLPPGVSRHGLDAAKRQQGPGPPPTGAGPGPPLAAAMGMSRGSCATGGAPGACGAACSGPGGSGGGFGGCGGCGIGGGGPSSCGGSGGPGGCGGAAGSCAIGGEAAAGREFRQSKELTMSPRTRAVYKDFSHTLRSKVRNAPPSQPHP